MKLNANELLDLSFLEQLAQERKQRTIINQSFKPFKTFKPFKSFTPHFPFDAAGPFSPADAGENQRGGLNGAKRLNGLNVWNQERGTYGISDDHL